MVVLYVDDDAEDIEIFVEAVKETDSTIKCVVAQNGRVAMDLLHSGLLPDFIFLDINMPVISGKAILTEIRKDHTFKSIPIVMYSTTVNGTEIEEYKKLGANLFLVKHSRYQELCNAVSEILRS